VKRASLVAFEAHAENCPTCERKDGRRDALCVKGLTLFAAFLKEELREPLH
jgi:hypothetical protein